MILPMQAEVAESQKYVSLNSNIVSYCANFQNPAIFNFAYNSN